MRTQCGHGHYCHVSAFGGVVDFIGGRTLPGEQGQPRRRDRDVPIGVNLSLANQAGDRRPRRHKREKSR